MKINKSKLDILEAQYTKEMNRANGGFMNELISILQGIQTERQRAKNPIFGSEDMPPPCGFTNKQNNVKARTQIDINAEITDLKRIITDDPLKFPEITSTVYEVSQGGDAGTEEGAVTFVELAKPSWVNLINMDLKDWKYSERETSKDWYDVEDLIRGIESKERAKKYEPKDVVYTLIDTSGSMMGTGKDGKTYLEILGGYIPYIVGSFNGEVWCVDTKIHAKYTNKEARDGFDAARELSIGGGGGNDWTGAFQELITLQTIKKAEFMTIILTDALMDWSLDLLKKIKNLIVVLPNEKEMIDAIPWQFFNDPEYPNAHCVLVDFFDNSVIKKDRK
tara:strand:+ start:182 stop:1186 length:1005 start_codon:yes stop_codon:yes gene_type:complete